MALILTRAKLALETRRKSGIDNEMKRDTPPVGFDEQVKAYKKKYPKAIHRPVRPCNTYNCHGLTFAARRTWIHDSLEIKKILEEDDYEEIKPQSVMAGDIAVYFEKGDAWHSGIVVEITPAGPRIISKWGQCHEVVHLIPECPYNATNVNYYRVTQ